MESIPKSRIEEAKRRIREKFTFEYVKKMPQYQGITHGNYLELIETLEKLCFLGISYYLSMSNSH